MVAGPSGLWAVVPVKSLALAKRRLDTVSSDQREELAYAMARRTLDALHASESVEQALIVTSDIRICCLAQSHGFTVLPDPHEGLNAAYAAGIAAARAAGAATMLLLPSDFATIGKADIDALIRQWTDRTAIGLLPCKNQDGTNAVLLTAKASFRPCFGPGSLAAHQAIAAPRHVLLHSASLACDIDTPDDLARYGADLVAQTAALPARLRDAGFGTTVTYSPKVFLPLTQLCRDVCAYCTFAKTPKSLAAPYMTVEKAVAIAAEGAKIGCKEALFTLGERPELRYRAAREWLDTQGFASTLHYLAHVAREVRDRTGLLPHINAGCMSAAEMAMLRPVSASMGLMLESTSQRLCEPGGPHYGSPDKAPALRLATIEEAGRQCIPFTTGILIGIGETRDERIESLAAIKQLHDRYGHIQEIIVQNFLPKADTRMANHAPASTDELIWTIRQARLMFGPAMSIQAPPNLNEGHLEELIEAGINDWGGVSPLTPDHVNPEAPWPEIRKLAAATENTGKQLAARLTVYPAYVVAGGRWIDTTMKRFVLEQADGAAMARDDQWRTGRSDSLPAAFRQMTAVYRPSDIVLLTDSILDYGSDGLGEQDIARLFNARDNDFRYVCEAADVIRHASNGDGATYVVNRNINYTNICGYRCTFCAFSKGTRKHEGAEKPYLLDLAEIGHRVAEAYARGASEVCLQGGIHPAFTGETYLDIVRAVKTAVPDMHVHAFSPLEISHGAKTLGMALDDYLSLLKANGLGSLPGTAAEILNDPVRDILCADKLTSEQWIEVIETAHNVGIPTTSTIMFGHIDSYRDWAIHLLRLRSLQGRTGGITEFVPLPFVAHEAPLYKRGQARPGPTLREAILMHAVARLVLHPLIPNVQASWVKLGQQGMRLALEAGANDMGGVLMNESITRAAGATHGQMMSADDMAAMARGLGRKLIRRTTLYGDAEEAFATSCSGTV